MNECWTFFTIAVGAKALSMGRLAAILLPNRETQAKFLIKTQQRDQNLLLVPDVEAPSGRSVQSVLVPTPLGRKRLSLTGIEPRWPSHVL